MTAADRELSSWKEIANYLGAGVRTVQDWERTRGLPVHRLPGGRGRVLTTTSELDAWKRSTNPAIAPEVRRHWRWAVPLVTVVLAAVVVLAHPHHGLPSHARVERNTLIITDEHDRELWQKTFASLATSSYTGEHNVWFGDLDGTGAISVVFLVTADRPGVPESLIAYHSDGRERWRFTPGRNIRTTTESFAPPFHPAQFLVAPLGRDRKIRIVVTSNHYLYYPCQLALLDNNGKMLREYWHSGHLQHLLATDLTHQGWNTLIAAGINNARKTATLVVLDPDHFTGASQEEDASYQLQGFPPNAETARLLFPRSCINEKLEPFTDITKLRHDGEDISLEVQHRLNPPDATIFYQLKADLTPNKVGVGSSFERAHLSLHASGIIDHDLNQPEITRFGTLTYLTGERPTIAHR